MLKSTLIVGVLAAALVQATPAAAALENSLEPAINGAVSASGMFPSQAMEDAFNAYLTWTKSRGVSRLAAFEERGLNLEPCINGAVSASGAFPTQEMEDQFQVYLRWAERAPAGRFYAFLTRNFD